MRRRDFIRGCLAAVVIPSLSVPEPTYGGVVWLGPVTEPQTVWMGNIDTYTTSDAVWSIWEIQALREDNTNQLPGRVSYG